MNIWTREELLEMIGQWKAAYKAVSLDKSYTIDGRTRVRHDASIIPGLTHVEKVLKWGNGK